MTDRDRIVAMLEHAEIPFKHCEEPVTTGSPPQEIPGATSIYAGDGPWGPDGAWATQPIAGGYSCFFSEFVFDAAGALIGVGGSTLTVRAAYPCCAQRKKPAHHGATRSEQCAGTMRAVSSDPNVLLMRCDACGRTALDSREGP